VQLDGLPEELILFICGSGLDIAPLERKDLDYRDLLSSGRTLSETLKNDGPFIIVFADLSVWLVSGDAPVRAVAHLASTDLEGLRTHLERLRDWRLAELR
jgi:hypothetical protein